MGKNTFPPYLQRLQTENSTFCKFFLSVYNSTVSILPSDAITFITSPENMLGGWGRHWSAASLTGTNQGWNLQLRDVPCPGAEPSVFGGWDDALSNWATWPGPHAITFCRYTFFWSVYSENLLPNLHEFIDSKLKLAFLMISFPKCHLNDACWDVGEQVFSLQFLFRNLKLKGGAGEELKGRKGRGDQASLCLIKVKALREYPQGLGQWNQQRTHIFLLQDGLLCPLNVSPV